MCFNFMNSKFIQEFNENQWLSIENYRLHENLLYHQSEQMLIFLSV